MKRGRTFWLTISQSFFVFSLSTAQVPRFSHSWGSLASEVGQAVTVAPSGNIYVSGYTQSSSSNNTDVLLLKYDPTGNFVWYRSWDFGGNEGGGGVTVDAYENIIITCGMNDNSDGLLLKVDSGGTLLWSKKWDLSWEADHYPQVDLNGNIYFCGQTIVGDIDAYVAKYDKDGDLLWLKTWNKNVNDAPSSSISVDSLGDVYYGGATGEWAACGLHDALVIKFDTSGTCSWGRTWDAGGNEGVVAIVSNGTGSLYATGWLTGAGNCPGLGGSDVFILKFDSTGNLIWQKKWGGSGDDVGASISIDRNGNIYISGSTNSFSGNNDVFLLKLDGSGNLLYQKIWTGAGDEIGNSVYLDNACNILLTGYAVNSSGGWQDATGVYDTLTGTVSNPQGSCGSPPTPHFSIPENITTVSPIVIDSGGGSSDMLLLKLQNKGDLNQDGSLTPADVVLELNCVFLGSGNCASCLTDNNCDGTLSPADVVNELNLVFLDINPPCQ